MPRLRRGAAVTYSFWRDEERMFFALLGLVLFWATFL